MSGFIRRILFAFACLAFLPSFVSSRDAILPHGDPGLQEPDAGGQARQEEIKTNRLKQQGQGENYRIEGELQGGTSGSTPSDAPGMGRQDTGIADPSVNPGQAVGTNNVQGRIVQSDEKTHTVRQGNGEETVLIVDDYTRGDTDLRPGDFITGKLTRQGRAVIVKKESPPER